MSTFVKFFYALVLFSLCFTACKKEEVDPNKEEEKEENIEETITNAMSAKINGADWVAESILVTMKDDVINITGVAEDGKEISITIQDDAEGEYTLSLVSPHVALYSPEKNSTTVFSSNGDASAGGDVMLETIDMGEKELTGSFSFKGVEPGGTESVEIADGNFTKVKIQ